MTPIKAKTAGRAAPPTYPLSDEQLNRVLAALPSLIADAPLAWHRTHRKWVVQEIAAFQPADSAQAGFAGQIVVLRHLAASMSSGIVLSANTIAKARRLRRAVAALTRTGEQMERTLRQWQKTARPPIAPMQPIARPQQFHPT